MNKIFLLSVLTVMLFANSLFAQDTKFESIFLYNFTRQLGWPKENQTGDIVIKIIGQSEITDQLNNFAKDKPVSGQNIVAKEVTIDDISDCHIIYITEEENDKLQDVINTVGDKSVLIVTEKPNQTSYGAGISFFMEDTSEGDAVLKYQYNIDNIKKQGIKVSSDFKSLGVSQ